MNEHGEHGPVGEPGLGDEAGRDDGPERESEQAGTDAARGEESERGE